MSTESLETQAAPEEMLTGHNYDGIQEYDNPLPGWWKFLFIVTVVFSPIYYAYFHAGPEGRSIHDDFGREQARYMIKRFAEIGDLTADRETILQYMNEPKWLAVGESVFSANCVSCHGANGEGGVGPNLTDEYWKNVKNVEDIAAVIQNGAANNAMPAWKTRLSHPNQIVLTAAYVAQLKPAPEGKAAEGNKVTAWDEN